MKLQFKSAFLSGARFYICLQAQVLQLVIRNNIERKGWRGIAQQKRPIISVFVLYAQKVVSIFT